MDSKIRSGYDVISTGSIGFDWKVLGIGGFVKGRMYEIRGWEGCLAEDTYIKFITVRKDGIVQDCKGSSIKHLYKRFHNRSVKTQQTEFNVISINEQDRIFRNPIADIVKTGKKECFKITTKQGFTLEATSDHKFYTGSDYKSLKNLNIGDKVYIHNNTTYKNSTKERLRYKETTVKYYYKGNSRLINGYPYYREKIHRLKFEAFQNNVTYDEYKDMLNSVDKLPSGWWTIPDQCDVHHKDGNTHNNDISNLELIDKSLHYRIHALANHNCLRFVAVPDEITSIVNVGKKETYDIKCYTPYNNYVANGIVVHNSGKSTICGHAVAECQRKGGSSLYIDGEYCLDIEYFRALGVDTSKLMISQPSNGEEGFNVAIEAARSGEVDLIIIDSDSSLLPKAVIDGDIGDSAIGKKARLNSDAYPKLKQAIVNNHVCVLVVSQYREKIGVMFGNPTTTQGGHALKFYSDCILEIARTSFEKDSNEVNQGNVTKVKSIKNKTFSPFKTATFNIIYGKGIDYIQELVEIGSEYGLITRAGSWYSYGETKIGQGTASVKALLEDNPELTDEIRSKVLEAIKGR